MRVIAVVNQKGGVGKTTTSVNLGAALALRGRRVLLVDMDPQGNLTDHLLGDPPDGDERRSVYDVLVEGRPIAECVVPTSTPGLSIVPSHEDMAGAELDLAAVIGREVILRDAMAEVPADRFDFAFLDCPPSLGLLSLNALAASDEVFIALQTEFFAMRGLSALDRTIDLVRRRINPGLRLGGIVATLVDPTRLSREVMEEVRGHYGDRVFATRVRTNIRLAEAPSHGRHIFDYAPDSAGAADYASLADEVLAGPRAVAEASTAPTAVDEGPTRASSAAAVAAAPTPTEAPARPSPRRGIARAIAEAAAAVGAASARGEGGPSPARPSSPALESTSALPAAEPSVEAAIASASPAGSERSDVAPAAVAAADERPAVSGPEPERSTLSASAVAVAAPIAPSPAAASVASPAPTPLRPVVSLPVVRGGRLSIAPRPPRAPSALPSVAVETGTVAAAADAAVASRTA